MLGYLHQSRNRTQSQWLATYLLMLSHLTSTVCRSYLVIGTFACADNLLIPVS